ncbi:putative helicase mov-10-B.2 [Trematomus bernacchii]|uniref:putative helicase mov-10-B.2 n=1 Tax=Trematomus bernacchii TaxID=40690 RepID=UPI00146BFFF9|nr:putative helicase mov-10-B.2 [Trematomus bernacchii]
MELEKMPLNWENYPTKFHLLLYLEELQQKTEIEKYNQDAPLFRHKDNRDLLILKIACAAKNSHSRLVGNKLRVCPLNPLGGLNETSYEAWVCHMDLENMWLQCSKGKNCDFGGSHQADSEKAALLSHPGVCPFQQCS